MMFSIYVMTYFKFSIKYRNDYLKMYITMTVVLCCVYLFLNERFVMCVFFNVFVLVLSVLMEFLKF